MVTYKTKVSLKDPLYAVVEIKITVPRSQQELAAAMGIGEEELKNLTNQELQVFINLLGNSDEV